MDHKGRKQVPVLALSQYVTNAALKTLKKALLHTGKAFFNGF